MEVQCKYIYSRTNNNQYTYINIIITMNISMNYNNYNNEYTYINIIISIRLLGKCVNPK